MFAHKKHNHKECVSQLENRISALESGSAIKLNDNENRVMAVLMRSHCALGAYEIADQASDQHKRLQPVQIYRAIDKLMDVGLVHKLKSEGGYVACHAGQNCNAPIFLICTSCRQVAEAENMMIDDAIKEAVKPTSFVLQNQNVELTGLCPNCS